MGAAKVSADAVSDLLGAEQLGRLDNGALTMDPLGFDEVKKVVPIHIPAPVPLPFSSVCMTWVQYEKAVPNPWRGKLACLHGENPTDRHGALTNCCARPLASGTHDMEETIRQENRRQKFSVTSVHTVDLR
jgi:hypothetical protein